MTWLATFVLAAALQQPVAVTGTVTDDSGLPVPGVTVSVKGGDLVAVTGADGTFAIASAATGSTLVFRLPGFEAVQHKISAASSKISITLSVAAVRQTMVVTASAPADGASQFLTPLDVVRVAGTQADLMRALQTLPGVAQIDEGAGLFVRGGDVSEVLTLVDGIPVNHPYRYETPTGGFRGAVDPFLTEGASFTTGGFAAPYGNALSAIVELATLGRPQRPQVNGTAGLAGVSFSGASPVGAHGGVRISGNRTTPSLLFKVNPSPQEFDRLPGGWDLSGSVYGESARAGKLRVFALAQSDHVGVQLEKDAFIGFLHSGTDHRFVVARWERALASGWHAFLAGGGDFYRKSTDVGVFLVHEEETHRSARGEVSGVIRAWDVRVGFDSGDAKSAVAGQVPEHGGDLGGVSGASGYTVDHRDTQVGVFATASHRFGRIVADTGLRADHFDQSDVWTADPRAAIRLQLPGKRSLRLAVGEYHQAASPAYFDLERGAVQLSPLSATHVIAGYEHGSMADHTMTRIEAYWKRYRDLPLEQTPDGFASSGYGSARGLDFFYRAASPIVDLRFSASVLHARRRWTSSDQLERYPLPDGTWRPDFAIPYSWQIVAEVPVHTGVSIASAWRVAAGRPFTPAIGATQTTDGYVPIWGAINSDQLPKYERFDLSANFLKPLGGKTTAIFFVSLDNVFNHHNFFEYAYSNDYSERRPVSAAAPRSFYIGCSITR